MSLIFETFGRPGRESLATLRVLTSAGRDHQMLSGRIAAWRSRLERVLALKVAETMLLCSAGAAGERLGMSGDG